MAQVVHKFGRNAAVGSTWEDIWTRGGVYAWPSTAGVINVFSSTAADTSAGTGARTLTIQGLSSDFTDLTETVSMSGTSTVQTSNRFQRVNRMFVDTAGVYNTLSAGPNVGTITLNTPGGDSVGAVEVDTIGLGQSQIGRYTVPAGHYGYVKAAFITVDSNKEADVAMFIRHDADVTSAPFGAKRLQLYFSGIGGAHDFTPKTGMGVYPAKTDIWWAAKASVSAIVSVDFEIALTDSPLERS